MNPSLDATYAIHGVGPPAGLSSAPLASTCHQALRAGRSQQVRHERHADKANPTEAAECTRLYMSMPKEDSTPSA